MGRLSNTEFLAQLGSILDANKGQSSIYVTQKRLSPSLDLDDVAGSTAAAASPVTDLASNVIPHADSSAARINTTKYPILVRISTNGAGAKKSKVQKSSSSISKSRSKISTVVEHELLDQFWADYANIIKNGFVGLKKKEKKKSKKGKVSK